VRWLWGIACDEDDVRRKEIEGLIGRRKEEENCGLKHREAKRDNSNEC